MGGGTPIAICVYVWRQNRCYLRKQALAWHGTLPQEVVDILKLLPVALESRILIFVVRGFNHEYIIVKICLVRL